MLAVTPRPGRRPCRQGVLPRNAIGAALPLGPDAIVSLTDERLRCRTWRLRGRHHAITQPYGRRAPTTRIAAEPETRSLAPFVVLLALVPLAYLLAGPGRTFRASRRLL